MNGNTTKMKRNWMTKYLLLLFLLLLVVNSYRKTVSHKTRQERKPGVVAKDRQSDDVKNNHTLKFQEGSLRSFFSLTIDKTKDHEDDKNELITNKIFWSDLSESFVPKGLSFNESMKLVKTIRGNAVQDLRQASMAMCGNSKNAIADLEDGTVMCVRYKEKPFFIHAEVLAFYLSRMLQMDNVPEVVLAMTNSSSELWRNVDIDTLAWKNNKTVAMMRRIPYVRSNTYEPQMIRDAYLKGHVITGNVIRNNQIKNPADIADLIQWGTLIVFDNLIGHYDRIHYWQKSNKGVIDGKLHNSLKSSDGKIWLIDHENSIFYQHGNRDPVYNFVQLTSLHDKMLKTICVFQTSLVKGLLALSEQPSPFKTLWNFTLSHEPLLETMQKDYRFEVFAKLFSRRLVQIMQWVQRCKEMYI